MKVVHVVCGDLRTGGAALGALALHLALLDAGVDSYIITNGPSFDLKNTISIKPRFYQKIKLTMLLIYHKMRLFLTRRDKKSAFNSGKIGFLSYKNYLLQDADIVHLHWINNFIDITNILAINKPLVWTLRDMWVFTGGCHYSLNCTNFKEQCGNCIQLNSNTIHDYSTEILKTKAKLANSNINFVAISKWLESSAKQSSVLKKENIKVIHNCIDTNHFQAADNVSSIKKDLGIPTDKKIILFGARNNSNFYKGTSIFWDSLQYISCDYFIVSFGHLDVRSVPTTYQHIHHNIGYVEHSQLPLIYSCADVFVAPSIQEAFGKTLAESLACSTPVVAFDGSGPRDIINHNINGYLAEFNSAIDLARGIQHIISLSNYHYREYCNAARKSAVQNFSYVSVSSKYIELYRKLLNQ